LFFDNSKKQTFPLFYNTSIFASFGDDIDLEQWLDKEILPVFDWREKCKWKENFVQSSRNYVSVSFGFEVIVEIPYRLLQDLDQKKGDEIKIKQLLAISSPQRARP